MTKGNERRFYVTDGSHSTMTWLEGEQSNSFNRSSETIDVTDKDGDWAAFIAGRKSATADVTVHLDDSASGPQKDLLDSFDNGEKVYCFVGYVSLPNTPSEGDLFEAIITAINDTNDKDAVASRQFSLQVTGKPTHYRA